MRTIRSCSCHLYALDSQTTAPGCCKGTPGFIGSALAATSMGTTGRRRGMHHQSAISGSGHWQRADALNAADHPASDGSPSRASHSSSHQAASLMRHKEQFTAAATVMISTSPRGTPGWNACSCPPAAAPRPQRALA